MTAQKQAPLVLVTRPEPAATKLRSTLQNLGYRVLSAPMLRIEPIDVVASTDFNKVAAVAFTSANAARALSDALSQDASLQQRISTLAAFCVGEATADAVRPLGFRCVATAEGDGRTLERAIVAAKPIDAILHLRGADIAYDLTKGLAANGVTLREKIVYRAVAETTLPKSVADALDENMIDIILFFSERAASAFLAAASSKALKRLIAICVSERVAAPLRNTVDIRISKTPSTADVIDTLRSTSPIARSLAE